MSETTGRCRSEVDDCYGGLPLVAIADAIDRLAADVAAIKAAILQQTTEERDAAIRERDEARAEVERLKAELAARLADGNRQATLDSSPAAPPPAAPPPGWLTDDERELLQSRSRALRRWLVGRLPPPIEVTREVDLIDGILARAGSPPVVVLPTVFQHSSLGDKLVALQQVQDALDKAGVQWKEVGRE